jgi:hypothetical protein
MNPRVKYLAELAAKARGCSVTDFTEAALEESFKGVTLRRPPEPEPSYGHDCRPFLPSPPDAEEERVANEAMSVANLAHRLWNESEFLRIQNLHAVAPHLLTPEHSALLMYLHTRTDLKIPSQHVANGYKLDREKIIAQWDAIQHSFKQQSA